MSQAETPRILIDGAEPTDGKIRLARALVRDGDKRDFYVSDRIRAIARLQTEAEKAGFSDDF